MPSPRFDQTPQDEEAAAHQPLLEKEPSHKDSSLLKRGSVAAKRMVSSVVHTFAPYEDTDVEYKAPNPSSLMLFGMHFGMACLEILGIFAGYMFLLVNGDVIFTKCSDFTIIDKWLGTHTGHGWLCETTSALLWTFPLVCAIFIPMLAYWEFCDSRLWYECLRYKIMLRFQDREFFTSPVVILLILYFLGGLSTVFFTTARSSREWMDVMKAIIPFLLPVATFMITLWLSWELKYFLITLCRFTGETDEELEWAKRHLYGCVGVDEKELKLTYFWLLDQGGEQCPACRLRRVKGDECHDCKSCSGTGKVPELRDDMDSADLFDNLRTGIIARKEKHKNRKTQRLTDTPASISSGEIVTGSTEVGFGHVFTTPRGYDAEDASVVQFMDSHRKRFSALVCYTPGFWVLDLLWLPKDDRALQFRHAFRSFAVCVHLTELVMVYLLMVTILAHLETQGHIDIHDYHGFFSLRDFMIRRGARQS